MLPATLAANHLHTRDCLPPMPFWVSLDSQGAYCERFNQNLARFTFRPLSDERYRREAAGRSMDH